ncbi:YbaN family protein [Geomonas sp. Red69]|uniref:YbaN family protein n=1 Tax=Geomonas diazotrophica TaxID=2843197 RepID=A0ABX8JNY1_9BACT|nr:MULTISPECIES: YbaN family protein [Geomonas]MBU5636905.1 YbaN family protein [Geomonas diazotrophica]QWV98801.1 YbaN family protein [Geomonas nitrogeniifigens]QXE87957.1 YbaN family protein [Geomonas nitrogeniifigens]
MQHRHLKVRLVKSEWLRYLLIGTGVLSLAAGGVGLFLPLVPTIPFLLVAVICFSRSSERFHTWLVEHRHFGPMLKEYLAHGSIPLRVKCLVIGAIWVSFPVTAFVFVAAAWLRILLLFIAACITVYLLMLPTAPRRAKDPESGEGEP